MRGARLLVYTYHLHNEGHGACCTNELSEPSLQVLQHVNKTHFYTHSRRHKMTRSAPVDRHTVFARLKYKKGVNKLLGIIQQTYKFLESLGCVFGR